MSDWVDVAPESELLPGQWRIVDVDDVEVAVVNVGGEFFAIEDVCTHDGAPLMGGALEDHQVICPRHGARFCLRTGTALTAPAFEPVATFPVRVEAGMVQVRDPRWD